MINELSTSADVRQFIRNHPSVRNKIELNLSLPVFRDIKIVTTKEVELLKSVGVTVNDTSFRPSVVVLERNQKYLDLELFLSGHGENVIVLEHKANLKGKIHLFEKGHHLFAWGQSSSDQMSNINAFLRGHECGILFGRNGALNSTTLWAENNNQSIMVGDDYLISWNTCIRTADSHAIIDCESREIVNKPESVRIGSHVWIGQDAMIMPGVNVGSGSIIGAKALVTKDVPERSVAAGVPARAVRSNATWHRKPEPTAEEIVWMFAYPILQSRS